MELSKVNKAEALYNDRNTIKTSIALCIRYWTSYKVFGYEVFLHRANRVAMSEINVKVSSMELYLCNIFLNIELENYDKSQAMLANVNKYKSYLKSNNKNLYAIFICLYGVLELRKHNKKSAEKYLTILEDYESDLNTGLLELLIGFIKLEQKEVNKALRYFEQSYERGNRSSFLFTFLNDIFKLNLRNLKEESLLLHFLNWGISQGMDLTKIVDFYCKEVNMVLPEEIELLERIYDYYNDSLILKKICANLIKAKNYSEKAYKYYRDAEFKQIQLDGLIQAIVKTAQITGNENLSRYTVEQFLKNEKLDKELAPFVFHLLVTSKKFKDLVQENIDTIIQYGAFALQKDYRGRYFNSIYKFMLEFSKSNNIPDEFIKKIVENISKNVFVFEIFTSNPKVAHVWITEKEKKEMTLCNLENGYGRVRASSPKFSYVCFDKGMKNIQDETLVITNQVENADIDLYLYLFKTGMITLELLIVLSKHFISLNKFEEYSIGVLNKTLEQLGISDSFKMYLGASIGNILFSQSNTSGALQYYKKVDDQYLSDKYIEKMLNVFISTKEYEKAVLLISKSSHLVSNDTLFTAINKIPNEKELGGKIAAEAYDLLIKSWYDKSILDIVLNHYKGSQLKWQKLNRVLMAMNVTEPRLMEIILKNSVEMHIFDEESQLVFAEMYENDPNNELVGAFAYYCIYEMIVNKSKIEYEALNVLERIYIQTKDRLLAYGLSHNYLQNKTDTLDTENILKDALKFMEEDNLTFPVFKNIKDKNLTTPYIEKNEPLIYIGAPKKDVYVYYRIDDGQKYRKEKMRYFRFGIYMCNIALFYGEKLSYYFSEEKASGSIDTKEFNLQKDRLYVNDKEMDSYFNINNALVYEQMFKYAEVESIITEMLKEQKITRAKSI